jgi:hypothetical protein
MYANATMIPVQTVQESGEGEWWRARERGIQL